MMQAKIIPLRSRHQVLHFLLQGHKSFTFCVQKQRLQVRFLRQLSSQSNIEDLLVDADGTDLPAGPVSSAYWRQIKAGKIRHDEDQLRLSARLDQLFRELKKTDAKVLPPDRLSIDLFAADHQFMAKKKSRLALIPGKLKSWFYRSLLQPTPPKGIYIYGHVGVGKSFLMDLFHHTALKSDTAAKHRQLRRSHFHEFMLDVHERIHQRKIDFPKQDALPSVALSLARESRVLCFDEFQVTDIADAMILRRLFHMLWEAGVVVVATSNRSPDTLYEGGLNRALFLPFIDALKENLDCMPMVGETDYRRDNHHDDETTTLQSYFYPNDKESSRQALEDIFASGYGETRRNESIDVMMGRTVTIPRSNDVCCWFDFMDLCHRPLGAADYLAICTRYPILIIDNVPQLNDSKFNEARRFVTLIDAAYETKTRLVILASQVPLEDLLVDFQATFESHDGDEEIAGEAIQATTTTSTTDSTKIKQEPKQQETIFVKGEGGSSSSVATTFVRNADGTEVEWSATGRIGVSLAQLSAVRDVSFSFRRAESRLVEMNRPSWGRWKPSASSEQ